MPIECRKRVIRYEATRWGRYLGQKDAAGLSLPCRSCSQARISLSFFHSLCSLCVAVLFLVRTAEASPRPSAGDPCSTTAFKGLPPAAVAPRLQVRRPESRPLVPPAMIQCRPVCVCALGRCLRLPGLSAPLSRNFGPAAVSVGYLTSWNLFVNLIQASG